MTYDRLARVTLATMARPGSGATNFFGILYDTLDRRTETFRGSSFTTYSYDTSSRPNSISQNFYGGTGNVTKGFGYNAANEITSQTRNNDDYRFSGYATINRSYTTNALNQYTAAGSATFTYDLNGNLTSDGTNTYGYDAENRMTSASTSGGTTLTYDPLGRLYQTSSATFGITQFAYDGAHVVVEYNGGTGAIRRRFFWGPGADEPILQDEGGQWDCSGTKFLHTDALGSVAAAADCWGNRSNVNTYDEYGIPAASNWGRFQYTGQALIPDLGMYYYKARLYSPTLGRFMQTDPAGYADNLNAYAYVGDDPVNNVDPMGLATGQVTDPGLNHYTGGPEGFPIPPELVVTKYEDFGIHGASTLGASASNNGDPAPETLTITAKSRAKPQNAHQYHISVPTLCSAGQAFSDLKDAGMSAPGAPAAREGFTPRINLTGNNPISQYVNSSTRTIINTTLPTHIFYPGNVTIQVVPAAGGTSDINITGTGSGNDPFLNDLAGYGFFQFVSANSVAQVCSARAGVPGP